MSDLESFFDSIRTRHLEEVAAGIHDAECEFRANGHFLCNCRMRTRVASGFTEAPTLWVHYPVCSNCAKEVSHDGDSFVCETCHVSWAEAEEDAPGTFMDDYGVLDVAKWDSVHS